MKNYNIFIFESIEMIEIFNDADILESIVTDSDALLKSIEAEEVNLSKTFHLNLEKIPTHYNIEELFNSDEFNKQLKKLNFKKNELETTEETETFIEDTINIKFFSIYDKNSSELEQPKYIIYQDKDKSKKWTNVKCYKVNANMNGFYNKLTNKSVEIKKGDKTYIYQTNNSGNDWILQSQEENDKFKKDMNNDDIKAILIDDDVSITILA